MASLFLVSIFIANCAFAADSVYFEEMRKKVTTSKEEIRRMLFKEELRKMFKIQIPLKAGERVAIIFPDGSSESLGIVTHIPERAKYPGYTASHYGGGGAVGATAVNAHHIVINVEAGEGRTISLVPSDTYVTAAGNGTSFVIEGTGGRELFGRYAPMVDSEVYAAMKDGSKVRFNKPELMNDFENKVDFIEIDVVRPDPIVDYIQIENKEGGRVWYKDDTGEHTIGEVERPVRGTGRFAGGLYQDAGFVRANHRGVICVSTSPRVHVGGFQIIPSAHSNSREMLEAKKKNQWILVRGINGADLRGAFPLFSKTIRPGDSSQKGATEGTVICRMGDNPAWVALPVVSGLTEDALADVTEIRIIVR